MFKTALTASPGVFAGADAAIWPNADPQQQSTTKPANSNFALRILLLLLNFSFLEINP
jgi:hypothetical protein